MSMVNSDRFYFHFFKNCVQSGLNFFFFEIIIVSPISFSGLGRFNRELLFTGWLSFVADISWMSWMDVCDAWVCLFVREGLKLDQIAKKNVTMELPFPNNEVFPPFQLLSECAKQLHWACSVFQVWACSSCSLPFAQRSRPWKYAPWTPKMSDLHGTCKYRSMKNGTKIDRLQELYEDREQYI